MRRVPLATLAGRGIHAPSKYRGIHAADIIARLTRSAGGRRGIAGTCCAACTLRASMPALSAGIHARTTPRYLAAPRPLTRDSVSAHAERPSARRGRREFETAALNAGGSRLVLRTRPLVDFFSARLSGEVAALTAAAVKPVKFVADHASTSHAFITNVSIPPAR